jgi:hypothetical protein
LKVRNERENEWRRDQVESSEDTTVATTAASVVVLIFLGGVESRGAG